MGMLALLLLSRPVQAELYVAGQVGAHMPNDASNVTWSGSGALFSGSDLSRQTSLMYGAKLGYYFDQLKFGKFNLGVETEVFNATPHFQQQGATIGSLSGILLGLRNRVLTWAPVVVLVRYQAGAFEPYAGVGLGVFFSNLETRSQSDASTHVGLNTQVGIRYRVNQHLSVFTEWKYNYANIEHDNIAGSALSMSYDYNAHIVAGGIGYHF
ncbi:MAG: outer membrane beta-barrel protein [Nitrospira sp.]|nr:outer membrane beta-barrel protein [Nitrospira sp.]MBH0180606.1 outer membrane beta-barrel protein [Nitrospira sp.]MBH0186895.1 outer membrane beta-barrel protein [Nitrospira sp.]MBH0188091.1 outer membrane beta-barrel protein [Nitrospira sp.]MBH0197321.1 outer membrane beta-barrel protein [Nitrospira sp.]